MASGRDKADPFLPFWATSSRTFQDTVTLANIRPMQLKLLGMAWTGEQKADLRILVELPDGKSALLNSRTYIGPYRGKITSIQERSVVIVEICQDILGQPEKKLTVLTLPPQEEEHE